MAYLQLNDGLFTILGWPIYNFTWEVLLQYLAEITPVLHRYYSSTSLRLLANIYADRLEYINMR